MNGKYQTLREILDFNTLSITRARNPNDTTQDGYQAYLEPSFGASSGISHEVWGESLIEVILAIEESINEKDLTFK